MLGFYPRQIIRQWPPYYSHNITSMKYEEHQKHQTRLITMRKQPSYFEGFVFVLVVAAAALISVIVHAVVVHGQ